MIDQLSLPTLKTVNLVYRGSAIGSTIVHGQLYMSPPALFRNTHGADAINSIVSPPAAHSGSSNVPAAIRM